MNSKTRLSISFAADRLKALKAEAKRLEISIGELVRRVVDLYLEKQEKRK